jgi:hypothetical protein
MNKKASSTILKVFLAMLMFNPPKAFGLTFIILRNYPGFV